MLYKSFCIGPEIFVKVLSSEKCFSKDSFDQIRINCTPNDSKFLYFETVNEN